jgi:hypothetical protein
MLGRNVMKKEVLYNLIVKLAIGVVSITIVSFLGIFQDITLWVFSVLVITGAFFIVFLTFK